MLRSALKPELIKDVQVMHYSDLLWPDAAANGDDLGYLMAAAEGRNLSPLQCSRAGAVLVSGSGEAATSRNCRSGAQHRLRHSEKVAGLAVRFAVKTAPDQGPTLQGSWANFKIELGY